MYCVYYDITLHTNIIFQFPLQESLASMESSGSTVAASVNDPRPPSATSEVTEPQEVNKLKPHSLYHLHVCLRNGRELIAKDSSGTSDPYVKFYWRGKQVYKSKTIDKDLNPVWDESFILAIDDPFMPMEIKVRGKRRFFFIIIKWDGGLFTLI